MWTREMNNTINALMEMVANTTDVSIEEECEMVCTQCPYASKCTEDEFFHFGCDNWEEMMGEDL